MSSQEPSFPSSVMDMAALGQLWEKHAPDLLAMLRRRIDPALASRIDPEDVLSETFLLARHKWNDFKAGSKMTPYAWLYGIARDCLIEAWRKQTRQKCDVHRDMPMPEHSSIQLGLGIVSPGTSPSDKVAHEELVQRVREVMEQLSDNDREILAMRHFDNLTFAEAATLLSITENAASVRYVRALKRLRKLWQGVHGTD